MKPQGSTSLSRMPNRTTYSEICEVAQLLQQVTPANIHYWSTTVAVFIIVVAVVVTAHVLSAFTYWKG